MKNLSNEELIYKLIGAVENEIGQALHPIDDNHVIWAYKAELLSRLNRLEELEKYRETCKENEIPCGNKDCEFLSKIFDQSCGAENQGETALIECKRYIPSVDNIITQNAELMNRLAEAELQISIIKQKYIKERNEHANDNIYWFNEVHDRQQRLAEAEKQLKERELTSICVYCGTKLISKSTDTKMNDVIEHMAECKKHPVPILLDKLAEIEKWFIQHGEHTLEIWNGYAKLHNEGMFTLAQSDNLTKEA